MTDGLTERDRKGILSSLEACPKIRRAILFGSRATGTFRGASDIDLALEGDGINLTDLVAINARISRLKLPFEADFVIRVKINNPDLEKHIREYGRVFYEGGANEWKTYQIAGLITQGKLFIGDGYRAKNEELGRTGLPFARAGNINCGFRFSDSDCFPEENLSHIGNKVSQPGDVVFTSKGTVGRFALVRNDTPRFVYSPQLCFWRVLDNEAIDPRYLYYWMHGREFFLQFKGAAGQTDMAEYVSLGDQRRMHIKIPEIKEQRAIASVLGALDDKIELNRRMNETLEAMAQALFRNWFVKAAQSGLPKGWRYATIAELCQINSWTLSQSDVLDQIEYVEISEVVRGDIGNIQTYERGEEPSRARRRLRHGDTVLSTVRPERGSYFLCLHPSPCLIASTGFAVLTPTKAPWSFIHAAMTQTDVFEHLGRQADGGAYPAVRPEVIGGLEVPWPGKLEVVDAFHRVCAPLYERAWHNRHESRTLAALREALLPKLLSGRLRVPNMEKVAEVKA